MNMDHLMLLLPLHTRYEVCDVYMNESNDIQHIIIYCLIFLIDLDLNQRMPNDVALAKEAGGDGEIDIILGGHDHHYEDTVVNNVRILNSGCDFKSFTTINVLGRDGQTGALQTKSQRVNVSPEEDEPDEEVMKMIQQSKEAVGKSMCNVVGRTRVPLDARFTETRRGETNIGNFLAELMVRGTGADIALLNAGTIRADRFIEKGEITMRDLMAILVSV